MSQQTFTPADRFQYAPGRSQQPWFETPQPRGRWVWQPDWYPPGRIPFDCPACRNGGVCMCVRPEREVTCLGIDPAGKELSVAYLTVTATGGVAIG